MLCTHILAGQWEVGVAFEPSGFEQSDMHYFSPIHLQQVINTNTAAYRSAPFRWDNADDLFSRSGEPRGGGCRGGGCGGGGCRG
jgi:hypothetical protein